MIAWLKQRLGKTPVLRHCRECGTIVPAGAGTCPRCHSIDIEDHLPNKHQQDAAAGPGGN